MAVELRYLTQEDLVQVGGLDMGPIVNDVEDVYRLLGQGQCILPSKVVLRWGSKESERTSRGHINAMPGYVGGNYDMAGQKWAAGFYQNPIGHGLPSVTALVILNDPMIGLPMAVMDGTLISAMRTGAQAGVAAKYLAREDSKIVSLIGAGAQARTLLLALKETLPGLSKSLVYDIQEERATRFCQEMQEQAQVEMEVVKTAQQAASLADILVTATTAVEPIVQKGWVPEGCLFCQMGAYECEPDAIREFDKIVVDNWSEVLHREVPALAIAKAEGAISDDDIHAEISDVILGRKTGRESPAERIYFSAVGMGLLDIAVGTRLLRQAEKDQVGTMLPLWETPVFI